MSRELLNPPVDLLPTLPEVLARQFNPDNKDEVRFLFIDIETTRFVAPTPMPWDVKNELVSLVSALWILYRNDDHKWCLVLDATGIYHPPTETHVTGVNPLHQDLADADYVIAHNLHGFDLHWLRSKQMERCFGFNLEDVSLTGDTEYETIPWYDKTYWCTMIAEYMLSAQYHKHMPLGEAKDYYKDTGDYSDILLDKLDVIKEQFWDKDIDTDEVPKEMLLEYNIRDVAALTRLFAVQAIILDATVDAFDSSTNALLHWRMHSAMCTSDMTRNGVFYDRINSDTEAEYLESLYDGLAGRCDDALSKLLPPNYVMHLGTDLTSLSNTQLSICLLGGEYTVIEDVNIKDDAGFPVRYKTGKRAGEIKTKQVKVKHYFTGVLNKLSVPEKKKICGNRGKNGLYSMSESVVDQLKAHIYKHSTYSIDIVMLIDNIVLMRNTQKMASTYLRGYASHVCDYDLRLHTKYNECLTKTGRLSSSSPNLQNAPTHPVAGCNVKAHICASEGFKLFELDFSGMELHGLAIASMSERLIKQLKNGEDLHTELGKVAFGKSTITKEERAVAKTIRFASIYGAMANSLAEQTGISVSQAQMFLDSLSALYPEVDALVKTWEVSVNDSSNWVEVTKADGTTEIVSIVMSESGRLYHFVSQINKRGQRYFPITKIKNYPIQGFSTGDIVPIALANMFYSIYAAGRQDDCRALLAVHDSAMFEIKEECYYEVAQMLVHAAENIKTAVEQLIQREIPFNKFPVEYKQGYNWADLSEFKLEDYV